MKHITTRKKFLNRAIDNVSNAETQTIHNLIPREDFVNDDDLKETYSYMIVAQSSKESMLSLKPLDDDEYVKSIGLPKVKDFDGFKKRKCSI